MASTKVLDLEDGFLRVPDHPEDDGVDVHRHRVAGERGLRGDAGHADPLIDVGAERLDDRDDVAESGPAKADVAAEPQHGDFLPLPHDLDGEQEIESDQTPADGVRVLFGGLL